MSRKNLIYGGIGVLLLTILVGGFFLGRKDKVDFNTEIRPILNGKCMRCHGGVKRQGGLSLLFRSEALEGGESGNPAIVPGSPQKSEMIARIHHHDPEERMPLEMEPLSEEEIALITRWIKEGAEWTDHWAYVVPQMPKIPSVSPKKGAKNPVDNFVFARLEKEGLSPAPEADRATLLRRLSLDLTGLPPTMEEVEAFSSDVSPEAYEKVVDRLLASPHFGERWAAMWLDLARYADSQGYEKDPYRSIWKYRDWVIRAFNENKPFDQFTREQLAGDLLPNATADQLIATAFHRNTMNNTEGGTEDQEYRTAAVIDRVNTTWTVWQGTTMECVQCHSHPYDPFRQEDYYRFMAFFNNTQDADLDTEFPTLETFSAKNDSAIREIIGWINKKYAHGSIDTTLDLISQIKTAIRPRLLPWDCDDYNDVEINWDKSADNWARLPKNIPYKSFFLKYNDIDLSGLNSFSFRYTCAGDKGKLEVRMDDPKGPIVAEINLKATRNGPATIKTPKTAGEGIHDIYLSLVNTHAEQSDPDGNLRLYETVLNYEGVPAPNPQLIAWQDSLLRLRRKAEQTPIIRSRTENNLRKTHVFTRGNWLAPTDEVSAAMPGSLPQLSPDAPNSRLTAADWLVSPENPLTARVTVNRFWEQLFGRGIVETLEDFGTQGIPPSHPELLDWLALHFSEELKWDIKALLKTLVMSATYRQSSKVSEEVLAYDPQNRLFSRGPRIRLTAEQMRDQALAVSGLLSEKMYGKPVMPQQPEGFWQVVYSGEQWITSEGEDRYRRAIYTQWRRTSPYPSMTTFDSPSREFCVSRRIPTNTPLQALVTLNDPVYVEAATAFAQRMAEEGGENTEEQIRTGYKLALLQEPGPVAQETLVELYKAAEKEAQISPLTVVANAILNLDSFIMKE
ncbi:MAG: DUF1549 domain-containing protein [Bacteroidia bacterium]|nr:DUF1549 domain-containing protein [Bacteroidia bacterium]